MQNKMFEQLEKLSAQSGFLDFIEEIPDHRIERKKLYSVAEIIFCAFCGFIANCNSWEDLETFGTAKIDFLRKFLPYANGTPSDDTFRRFFRVLEPAIFAQKFEIWVSEIVKKNTEEPNSNISNIDSKNDVQRPELENIQDNENKSISINNQSEATYQVIAIDGKTSRGSRAEDQSVLHTVSAFSTASRLTLAQRKVDCKTNEITVIPTLLKTLDLTKTIVTIDAMGTQYGIANQIRSQHGHYILSLKGNQKNLKSDVVEIFNTYKCTDNESISTFVDSEKGHGRFEKRTCTVISDPEVIKNLLEDREHWGAVRSIVKIVSERTIKETKTVEDRYYISSLTCRAEKIASSIRSHWAIENSLHWTLDVAFGDDNSQVKKGNAPHNMLIIKHAALNLLQIIKLKFERIQGVRTSIPRLRKLAGWVDDWLLTILRADYQKN
jgi:predicted transposase YbfD/YdcC